MSLNNPKTLLWHSPNHLCYPFIKKLLAKRPAGGAAGDDLLFEHALLMALHALLVRENLLYSPVLRNTCANQLPADSLFPKPFILPLYKKITGQKTSLPSIFRPIMWACPFGSGYRAVSFWARLSALFQYITHRAPRKDTCAYPSRKTRPPHTPASPAITAAPHCSCACAPEINSRPNPHSLCSAQQAATRAAPTTKKHLRDIITQTRKTYCPKHEPRTTSNHTAENCCKLWGLIISPQIEQKHRAGDSKNDSDT